MSVIPYQLLKATLFFSLFLFISCSSGTSTNQASNEASTNSEANSVEFDTTVEVIYMHGKSRCPSCLAIEEVTKETIARLFSNEIENGSLVLSIVDIDNPANLSVAEKYNAVGSALLVCKKTDDSETVTDLTGDGFRFGLRDKAKLSSVLRNTIEESLNL